MGHRRVAGSSEKIETEREKVCGKVAKRGEEENVYIMCL